MLCECARPRPKRQAGLSCSLLSFLLFLPPLFKIQLRPPNVQTDLCPQLRVGSGLREVLHDPPWVLRSLDILSDSVTDDRRIVGGAIEISSNLGCERIGQGGPGFLAWSEAVALRAAVPRLLQ